MKRLAAASLAASLLLGGCYVSRDLLLDGSKAAFPLATGAQMTAGWDPEAVTVTREADGWYLMRGEDEDNRVLFNSLPTADPGRPRYGYAVRQPIGFIYGVAEKRDGRVHLHVPTCEDDGRAVALAHNAVVEASDPAARAPECEFRARADLLAALTEAAERVAGKDGRIDLPAAP